MEVALAAFGGASSAGRPSRAASAEASARRATLAAPHSAAARYPAPSPRAAAVRCRALDVRASSAGSTRGPSKGGRGSDAKVATPLDPSERHDPVYPRDNDAAPGGVARVPLNRLAVGSPVEGRVVAHLLYAGAVIDVGAELHGLVAVHELDWFDARGHLPLGATVKARVKAVRDVRRFRFPVELELVSPALGHVLREPPPTYPPILVYEEEADMSPEQLAKEAGRPWPPPRSAAEIQREELMAKIHAVLEDAATRRLEKKRRVRRGSDVLPPSAAPAGVEEDEDEDDEDGEDDLPKEDEEEGAWGDEVV